MEIVMPKAVVSIASQIPPDKSCMFTADPDSAMAPKAVISQQMIEEAGAHNLSEVLNMISGVTYSGTAVGSGEPLQMNGFSDEYVKVLVDGVPVNTGGGPNALQMLSLDNVDHIEVMNGSASALYGSDAIAGVINIITKKGSSDQPFSFYVEQEGHTNMNFKNLSGKGLNGATSTNSWKALCRYCPFFQPASYHCWPSLFTHICGATSEGIFG